MAKLDCVKGNQDVYITLETHGMSLQKWACIFTIFHAVVLLDSSN